MVPSVMVGDKEGILTSVPGVDPPLGWLTASASPEAASFTPVETSAPVEAAATDVQSSPSSARTAISVPT